MGEPGISFILRFPHSPIPKLVARHSDCMPEIMECVMHTWCNRLHTVCNNYHCKCYPHNYKRRQKCPPYFLFFTNYLFHSFTSFFVFYFLNLQIHLPVNSPFF